MNKLMANYHSLKNINNNPKHQTGFTIIEVVLVLAIAGLIFLTVFLAVPNMQKAQRDNARKQDVGKVIAGLQQYRVDNGGWPASATYTTTSGYFIGLAQASAVWVRPSGATCGFAADDGALSIATVAPGCKCDQVGTTDTSARFGYVHLKLEVGGAYCRQI